MLSRNRTWNISWSKQNCSVHLILWIKENNVKKREMKLFANRTENSLQTSDKIDTALCVLVCLSAYLTALFPFQEFHFSKPMFAKHPFSRERIPPSMDGHSIHFSATPSSVLLREHHYCPRQWNAASHVTFVVSLWKERDIAVTTG